MTYSNKGQPVNQYRQVSAQSEIMDADPHRLIQMLMEGALDKIAAAKGFMIRGVVAEKGLQISFAISIVDGLRMSLDKELGGDIAANLDALYDYMGRRLLAANVENNPAYLDEVASLIKEVKSAWDAIPANVRKQAKQDQALPNHAIVNVIG